MVDRFPGNWDAASIKLDRIVYQPAGQRDIAERLGPTDAGVVMKEPKLGLIGQPALAYETMGFNMANTSPLQNPLVREAFEAAIDRGVINQVVMDEQFIPSNQFAAPGSRRCRPCPRVSGFRRRGGGHFGYALIRNKVIIGKSE